VTLLGNRCRVCGETSFPDRAYCPRCRSEDLEPARIEGPAKLMSWTVVHQAPPAFTTPLAVGYAVLPGNVVVLGPIDAPRERLAKDLRLRVVEGQTSVASDGTPLVSYRFAPDDPEAPRHA
jgi:uncharacterized OB-fold protein